MIPPSLDPFYGPVHSAEEPGALARVRRVDPPLAVASRAWQVVFHSTSTNGRRVAMSGTILVPEALWAGPGPRPVLGYGVGVHGLSRDAAPSYLLARGEEPEQYAVEAVLRRGWIVAVPDGEGLGMPGPHTYGAGEPGGCALLDLVRAAASVTPEARPHAPVLLWGYSEGGRCAAFAAELQPTYAPELDLRGTAAGGVPADLHAVARAIDGGPFSGLALAVLVGLAIAHDEPRLWGILNERGRSAAWHATTLDVVGLIVEHPESLAELTGRTAPWDEPTWRAVLRREDAGGRAPAVPALLYHASHDDVVPIATGRGLARSWSRKGAAVTWSEVPAADHLAGGPAGAEAALSWLADRLAPGHDRSVTASVANLS